MMDLLKITKLDRTNSKLKLILKEESSKNYVTKI
jgi:hypothetical protein